jgi:hypothetical protein
VEYAEQMQQDDDEDRHAGQPEDDVSEHGTPPSSNWGAATVAKYEARRHRGVTVVSTL